MDISIIIVSYNAKDILNQTLVSLQESINHATKINPKLKIETIIVDNNSTDNALQVARSFKYTKVIENKINEGFSKANNMGVKNSDKNTKYFLFLNNDVVLAKDSIVKMYDYIITTKNVGIATCRVDLYTGGIDWDCHRGFPTVWNSFCYLFGLEKYFGDLIPKIFGQYHLKHLDLETTHEIDLCLGAFMLMPSKVLEKAGLWPEEYFLNGEDVDLCYNIKKILNYKIMYAPITTIIHYKGASKGTKKVSENYSNASLETKNKVVNSSINAMDIYYSKYFAHKNGFFINLIVKLGMKVLLLRRYLTKKE